LKSREDFLDALLLIFSEMLEFLVRILWFCGCSLTGPFLGLLSVAGKTAENAAMRVLDGIFIALGVDIEHPIFFVF
jgi:hypothetical protein